MIRDLGWFAAGVIVGILAFRLWVEIVYMNDDGDDWPRR